MPKHKSWFLIRNAAHGVGEISIYDEIGLWGVDARQFRDDLSALGDVHALNVYINSPGGDVFDGLAIHSMLARHPAKVTVNVDGIAASIASVIAMAGDEVLMPEGTMMMIHDPSGVVMGTADDMRDLAEALDKVKQSLVSAYRNKSGLDDARLAELMSEETWLTAAEAVELGLADRITEPVKMAANLNLSRFKNPPESIRNQGAIMPPENKDPAVETPASEAPATEATATDPVAPEAPAADPAEGEAPEAPQAPEATQEPAPAVDPAVQARLDASAIAQACQDAGVPTMAATLIKEGIDLETAKARIGSASEIRNLCAIAKMTDKADGFIAQGISPDAVRARLFDAMVEKDEATAVNGHHPEPQPKEGQSETPEKIALKARAHIAEQAAKGITVSAAAAVRFVTGGQK